MINVCYLLYLLTHLYSKKFSQIYTYSSSYSNLYRIERTISRISCYYDYDWFFIYIYFKVLVMSSAKGTRLLLWDFPESLWGTGS